MQEIPVDGDPDVEALNRQRKAAIQGQASLLMDLSAYRSMPDQPHRRLPVPIIMACDFCGVPVYNLKLRWKWVAVRTFREPTVKAVIPLGGMACAACYPLSKAELIKRHRKKER